MQNWKNIINSHSIGFNYFVGVTLLVLICTACKQSNSEVEKPTNKATTYKNTENVWQTSPNIIVGNALGTTFIIKTNGDSLRTSPEEIDALFERFNAELSTYIDSSLISKFNANNTAIDLSGTEYFKNCFEISQEIYNKTSGAFDPTVHPLVELWGFFKRNEHTPSQSEIDSVLNFVGLKPNQLYTYKENVLEKQDSRFKLVFNAIAKGQSVDVIADLLNKKGQTNYFIEVGGEIRVKGLNDQKAKWIIGIDVPKESNSGQEGVQNRALENYIEITDVAVATSGNYRDFYELEGKKYSHTISPVSGKPVKHSLLSATVIAPTTAMADAYATAFMVMGVDASLEFVKNNPDLGVDIYLLFDAGNGRIERAYSRGMLNYLIDR
ncbi:FAD:protein FMN transferase [Brumimicrobium salinarum]|nr:FAD:protein FMN transferase [Brumimicrobium salinarum]